MSTVLHPEMEEAFTAGMHRQPLVPIFVYGTLRVGHGNYEWCKGAVKRTQIGATSIGTIWFAYDHGSYPVAKFDEGNTTIVGDVLWFNPQHRSFDEVVSMEYGAGYVLVDIEYEHEGETLECMAFHYIGQPRGPKIESGDWAAAAGR
jgi:gamma-glutamylcyclotransferase (GGCT)/AIG2-like uncharacterized protein YtfP